MKTWLNVQPGFRIPEVNDSSPTLAVAFDTTVCANRPLFVQTTWVPADTYRVAGLKPQTAELHGPVTLSKIDTKLVLRDG